MKKQVRLLVLLLAVGVSAGFAGEEDVQDLIVDSERVIAGFISVAQNEAAPGGYLRQQHVYTPGPGGFGPFLDFLPHGVGLDAVDVMMQDEPECLGYFSVSRYGSVDGRFVNPGTIYEAGPGGIVAEIPVPVSDIDALAVINPDLVVISTKQSQAVQSNGGFEFLRQQNAYAYSLVDGSFTLCIDGVDLGLQTLDALETSELQIVLPFPGDDLPSTDLLLGDTASSFIISVSRNQALSTPCGTEYLWNQDAYLLDLASGCVATIFDGRFVELNTLDAFSTGENQGSF